MWRGLEQARHGARLGDVGSAIEAVAAEDGYGVVREYVGHGIGRALHEDPSVPNYGRAGKGLKMTKGWVIAIEPMFNLGTERTRTLDDEWTVVTEDGALSAHWEHTVAITEDGPWVLTARSDEPPTPSPRPCRFPATALGSGCPAGRARLPGGPGGYPAHALPCGRASSRRGRAALHLGAGSARPWTSPVAGAGTPRVAQPVHVMATHRDLDPESAWQRRKSPSRWRAP
jgi:hypothetical protein